MRPFFALLWCALLLLAQKQPFDASMMLRIARIGDPALSPNGRQVAFTVQTPDLDKNTKPQQIYVIPADGGVPLHRIKSRDENYERVAKETELTRHE